MTEPLILSLLTLGVAWAILRRDVRAQRRARVAARLGIAE
jgi:hypothetical protein